MSIADDLRASMCAGCIRYEQPRTEYCDRCGNDEFVGPVAELEAIVRELGEQPWHQGAGGSEVSNTDAENFTFEALESAIEQMKREAERPYRIVYIGPPYEGDYPPDDWPGWWCPQREYTDTEVTR